MVFLGSDIYHKLFENSNDPQYVLDLNTATYIAVNSAFCSLVGYAREEIEGHLTLKDITPTEDFPLIQQIQERRKKGIETERYLYRIKIKSGEIKPIEVSVRKISYSNQDLIVGSWRDLSERMSLEKILRERIRESALATNRIMALTEKIKGVPLVTTALLRASSENSLIEYLCKALCEQRRFAITGAAIYLRVNNHLEQRFSLNIKMPKRVDIRKNHPLVESLESESISEHITEIITLPIRGKNEPIGVMHLRFDPKERELLQGNPITRKGYLEVIKTISDILGLAVENIRLATDLKELSIKDGLTGVYNRRYFDKAISDEFKRAKRYGRQIALLFLDLDSFKQINDKYGHKQGDVMLREFSSLLGFHSRKIDIICRYGGDEFAIILPETSLEGALAKAEALKANTRKHAFTNLKDRRRPFHIKVSIGVSAMTKRTITPDQLVLIADNDLFAHKGIFKTGS
ncbi:MAG: sensor domain-containing diguanylate cyclase [Candidatus Brocadiia bacterium]